MASTALTTLNFVEHQPSRPAAVEADLVEPETQMTEVASLKTPSAAREAAATEDTHAAKININELSNTHKEQQQEEEDALKSGVTSQQDAATTVAVMPTALARCLTGLPTTRDKEDIQEIERLLSEGTRETSGGAIPSTTGCSRLKSGGGSCPKIKVKSGSGNSLANDSSSGRSGSQGIPGNTDESDVSSSNADGLRLSVYNEEATTTVNTSTFAVAATTAVDQAAEALSTRRQTQRAQQQNEDDLLTSSLQAVLQHRQNILEQENREMKEVLDLATQCKDREALAPKIQMLKEQLLAREQQHHAEKRELAATVKALLSASRCENEKERTELELQRQIPQKEQRSPQTEEKQGTTFCPQTRQGEAVDRDNDEKQQSKILQTQLYIADEMQGPHQQQQQKQLENLFCKSCVSMEKRKTPKPASTIGSGQQNSREEESRTAPESNKVRVSPVDSTVHASSKKELASAVDPAVKKEAPKIVETASKEASTSTLARCEQKCKSSKEVEQPRQQQSKQQRQPADEDKDSARRLKRSGSWWRQQVVNRLRLPGPNLTRKQFLSTFHHPETGVEVPLLNAVFDRLKIIVRPNEGIAEEAVTIPHVLDLLEKTNGSNILHTLDAAELLEANVRCIDRKMASQKTDLQVFAIRLMCRFFLALSKKTFGELEMTCRRVAPREAVRTYTEELENYRQTLIKAIAAEKNITIDQSTVVSNPYKQDIKFLQVVSKCIHNMRTELQNDLVMLQRVPPEARATQAEKPVIDLAKCRAQNSTLDKLTPSGNNSAPTVTTKGSKSAADATPHKLSAATPSLAVSVQTATLPSMYSYGAVRRVAAPGCPPFTASEIQALSNVHVSASPHGGAAAAAAAHPAAVAVPCAAPGVLPSNGSLVSTTSNSSAAASSPPPSSVGSAARPTVVLPSENTEPQQNGRISVPKLVRGIADQAGEATESEVLRQAARRQAQTKGVPCEKESPGIFEEISGASTTKMTTAAAAPAGTTAACTTPTENISQQGTMKREKDLSNLVQIIEYRYADGTPVTNPAHLPEGAKAVEAAARARLEETARVAQEAARRAEAVALAQFTAATAAGGGGTAAASVAAAQYQRAFAALSSNQESGQHDGTYRKLNAETEDVGNFSDSMVQRISSTIAAPNAVAQEEQQLQQAAPRGLQAMWKPQHVLAPTAVGGILRPLPAAVVAAAAVRRPAAPQPAPTSGTIGEATAEGAAAQKGNEVTGALLQRVSSFRGRTPGEYAFPSTDRAAPIKNPAAPADYSAAAAGLVPPGFPAGAAGQLQALLQQQRLLTAMPNMVVSAPKPTTAAYDTTQRTTQASATAAGTPSTSRGRVSRSLTPKATERDSFMRRSRGGCMGTSPRRKSKRSSNSSSRTASVSSIQRAAGRFFASLGLWKSNGEDEEEDTSSSSEAALHAHDGLAAATEQYLNGQQEKLQQQQEEQNLVPQQLSLQHLQQQKLQQQQQQLQQQQLQQQHLQQQLQHQQLQQQLQQATVLPGLPAFPAGPPSRIPTACEASPAELLSKATPGDGVAGRAGIYSMSPGVQQQALRHYVASDAAEQVAADPRAYCTENATEKTFLPVYSTLYAQQQYRLAQQQKQQEEQQRQQQHQQQQRPPSGEAWISTQSFLLKEVPGRLLAEQSTSSQLRAPEKSTPAALTAASAIEKRFTATMESILSAEAGEEEKKGATTTAEKPTGYLLSSPQRDFASVQLETQTDQQQRDQQQSYTAGAELAEKKTAKQQLQQVFLQQQRGGIQGGYNQATSRDTSVVTTHIPQQTDSPNAMHAAPAVAYTAADRLTQQAEGSQTMTSAIAGCQDPADGARLGQEAETSTATHLTVSSPCSTPAVGHSGNAAGALQAHQQPEPSQPVPPAFSPAAVAFAAPVTSSRVPQQPQISNTAAISSCAAAYATPTLGAAAFPPSVVRTRVSSIAEVPSPQLGAQQIGNFAQVQAQLDSLTQRQIEAYAQHYGLYATPQAAAAALGGVPLAGVGALGGPATCNGYAQFMSQHRPLPAVPPNYVFTKSS